MKTLLKMIALATVLFSGYTFAETQSADSFRFDCGAKKMPTQQAFGKLMGLSNFAEIYDERVRMRSNLLHECKSHTNAVLIVQVRPQAIQTAMQAEAATAIAPSPDRRVAIHDVASVRAAGSAAGGRRREEAFMTHRGPRSHQTSICGVSSTPSLSRTHDRTFSTSPRTSALVACGPATR